MALQKCGLNVTRGLKELQPHESLGFPCAGYQSYHSDAQTDSIPWHWHEELEILTIEEGAMEFKTPSQVFLLTAGDCFVINANILHAGAAVKECKLRSLVFHPLLITGDADSVFASKYLHPLLSCQAFFGCFLPHTKEETVLHWFCRAFHALAEEPVGFEFVVREQLSQICFYLYQHYASQFVDSNAAPNLDNIRMKKMLSFIHAHFTEPITLEEIAKEAAIGERECLRCFQRAIRFSPVQYLINYRILQGGKMLQSEPSKSISEISTLCGFDSPSNFAKQFKRVYMKTPGEYRKKQ